MSAVDYSPDYRCPEDAGIKIKSIVVDVQNEDRFSPSSSFAFNPLSDDLFDLRNFVFLVLLKKLGTEKLRLLLKDYMKNITNILVSVVESGKTHPITALNASTTFACVAQRFGIITDANYLKIVDQTRSIIDKLILKDFAGVAFDGLQHLTEGIKGTTILPKQTITDQLIRTQKT